MSSRDSLEASLRRLKPEKHRKRLVPRNRERLLFLSSAEPPYPPLLLDTTVYIDTLQGHLSENIKEKLRTGNLWHSPVTEAELSTLCGLLDPAKPATSQVIAEVAGIIEQRRPHRILTPNRSIWREAGILAGLLARLQQYGKSEQRKALNDALLFLTAAKHGCVVLTRNIADFDFLMQLEPRGSAIFYDRV